jgi:predicted RNase H-like HicB family nuclease
MRDSPHAFPFLLIHRGDLAIVIHGDPFRATGPVLHKEIVMETYRLQVIVEQDEDGLYVADVPALVGCHTQGRTFEEALDNIREVIAMCIREMREEGKTVETQYPEVVGIKTLEVAL